MHSQTYDTLIAVPAAVPRAQRFRWLCKEVGVAYLGGIGLGSPIGLIAVWLTGAEAILSAAIVSAMVGVFAYRRSHAPVRRA